MMDEREALRRLAADLPHAGDDAAIVDETVITTDMLHERTDFPEGTTRYTAGWRAVGASLSDVAAMGADATAAVAVYADVAFDPDELDAFVAGAQDVCETVDAEYVGGDLDTHGEFTTVTTALGETESPVFRSGAAVGDAVCVTGTWGRSAAALQLFGAGEVDGAARDVEHANELFRFTPRVTAGRTLGNVATAMMDSSDGLARSLHQLGEASEVGFEIERDAVPVHDAVRDVTSDSAERWELTAYFGEDFELVATVPPTELDALRDASPTPIARIGTVERADAGITVDGDPLPDRGYTHGAGTDAE